MWGNYGQGGAGQVLGGSALWLAQSVAATVSKRKGLVIRAIFGIRTVIDDCRSEVCWGFSAGIDSWNLSVGPREETESHKVSETSLPDPFLISFRD